MLISLSWKNIWRNKTRSIVIIFAIVFGVIGGVGFTAFYNGMIYQRLDAAIGNEVSNIQIHNPHFLENREINDTLYNISKLLPILDTSKQISSYAIRIKTLCMVNSANSSNGIMLLGIDPVNERKVTGIYKYVKQGQYLDSCKKNSILIGEKLASNLKIKLRSKVVVTLQSSSGDITSAAFKVAGIYNTGNNGFDERIAYVKYDDLAGIVGFETGKAHEIAITLVDDQMTDSLNQKLAVALPGYSVQSWKEIMPELGLMTDSSAYMLYIFMTIIFLALSFGIINTMLMAVLDRVREIGMLMAIGMSKARIFLMITFETILLMLTGSLLGLALSYILVEIFKVYGIDLSAFSSGLSDMGFESIVYPFIEVKSYVQIVIMVIITGILSSIVPARKALKLNPSEAIRTQ
jgi:ABC-type lipoprotein release transport system permease subunit